MKDFSKPI